MLNFFSGTTYATHSYVFSGLRSGGKPEVRVGRWVRDLRFAMCFPGLCRDIAARPSWPRRAWLDAQPSTCSSSLARGCAAPAPLNLAALTGGV